MAADCKSVTSVELVRIHPCPPIQIISKIMFTIENILSQSELETLIQLIDYEITNHLFTEPGFPLYQSSAIMHIKYKDHPVIKKLIESIVKNCPIKDLGVRSFWFNVCKEDSQFEFHTHNAPLTAVYFAKNCTDNGTILQINNTFVKTLAKDNSILFSDGGIPHSVPKWNGIERYSVAAELTQFKIGD